METRLNRTNHGLMTLHSNVLTAPQYGSIRLLGLFSFKLIY